jgi:hypothetical protein
VGVEYFSVPRLCRVSPDQSPHRRRFSLINHLIGEKKKKKKKKSCSHRRRKVGCLRSLSRQARQARHRRERAA